LQESLRDSLLFIPKALNILLFLAGLLTYPGFGKPSHSDDAPQWQVFLKTIITLLRDRASQQRVLLRIQTAFPFHGSVGRIGSFLF
jgi:hypothetical protein